jgi:hypothetical protein
MIENMTSIRTGEIVRKSVLGFSMELTQIWETDDEVGEHKGCRAVESIRTVFDVCCMVFQVTRDVCYGHERHECTTEELSRVSTSY